MFDRQSFISDFISDYISSISEALALANPAYRLTRCQKIWLSFCLTGLLLTNSINWSAYSRSSLGAYKVSALSWMFRHSHIDFNKLFTHSILHIVEMYGITTGKLVLDDSDRKRSKNAVHIHKLGKQKDKSSGGYFLGQNILFLLLVTPQVSIPIGFRFYVQDPNWLAWKREDERLRRKKVAKIYRPVEVSRDYEKYPTKLMLAAELLQEAQSIIGHLNIVCILADCFFGTAQLADSIEQLYPDSQFTSQLKKNQLILINGQYISLEQHFMQSKTPIKSTTITRGDSHQAQTIYYSSTIAKVKSHNCKRLIVAYKYEGEEEFRYLFAIKKSWMAHSVIESYSYRWLVEVFIQDWKQYEGWGQLSKHIGEDGTNSSLLLSLLYDHCLLLHPEQKARIKDKLPAFTVGSLRDKAVKEHLIKTIGYIIEAENPKELLQQLAKQIDQVYVLRTSTKHMSGRNVNFNKFKAQKKVA